MLVYVICTERKDGVLPQMDDPDIVDHRFFTSFEDADKARVKHKWDAHCAGFEVDYQIYSVHCIVQQRVEFEAPF